MDIDLTTIFGTYGTTKIARAMRLPISTINSWKSANAIPGADAPPHKRGPYEMRVQALKAAVAALKKNSKKRKAAA